MSLRADWKSAKKSIKTKDWEALVKFKDGLGPQLDNCHSLATKAATQPFSDAQKGLESLKTAVIEATKIIEKYHTAINNSELPPDDKSSLGKSLVKIDNALDKLTKSTEKMIGWSKSIISEAAIYGDL